MILVVTSRSDFTADWLILELERRGLPFTRFNTEDYPVRTRLAWTGDGAHLAFGKPILDLDTVKAVWYRRPAPPTLPAGLSLQRATWAATEAREALDGVWKTLTARWVNHPDANRLADCKPEQLRRALGMGFEVPATLVTNDPSAAQAFVRAQRSGVVCKPLYSGRIALDDKDHLFFTSRLDRDAIDALDELGPEPYLFQAFVPKRYDVRVTVVGDRVFAARIDSQSQTDATVDWRRGEVEGLQHSVEDLPAEVAGLCVDLVGAYGLQFGAIDLARTGDGYTFFEINPNGQWAWVEQRTGLPLRAALADLLAGAT